MMWPLTAQNARIRSMSVPDLKQLAEEVRWQATAVIGVIKLLT